MNREILFKGKRFDNGEWVEGDLVSDGVKYYIIVYFENYKHNDGQYSIKEVTSVEVDPETIGQYTCLKDKNGKKIFEGDIIRWEGWACDCEVIFFEGGFTIKQGNIEHTLGYEIGECPEDVEIIGNIYDKTIDNQQ